MRLIPVLDLKDGVVVRGVGGRRNEYRPVQSVVAASADPLDVATSLRERFGFREFYLADLDAIAGHGAHDDVVRQLSSRELRLLVDAGLRDEANARSLVQAGVDKVIAALETSPGPDHLRALVNKLGPARVTFSLDMKAGALLTPGDGWLLTVGAPASAGTGTKPDRRPEGGTPTAGTDFAETVSVAERALECGVRSLILLDLAGVGEGRGVPTLELCRAVRERSPDVEIITGGGVRDTADLEALAAAGVDAVLIASALHNGSLTPAECARWCP